MTNRKHYLEPNKPAVTLEEVRMALAEKSRDGFTAQVKALLTDYGANRLSDVDPSDYAGICFRMRRA